LTLRIDVAALIRQDGIELQLLANVLGNRCRPARLGTIKEPRHGLTSHPALSQQHAAVTSRAPGAEERQGRIVFERREKL
jgi:hypothetical protein